MLCGHHLEACNNFLLVFCKWSLMGQGVLQGLEASAFVWRCFLPAAHLSSVHSQLPTPCFHPVASVTLDPWQGSGFRYWGGSGLGVCPNAELCSWDTCKIAVTLRAASRWRGAALTRSTLSDLLVNRRHLDRLKERPQEKTKSFILWVSFDPMIKTFSFCTGSWKLCSLSYEEKQN